MKKKLDNVSLIAVSGNKYGETLNALYKSMKECDFYKNHSLENMDGEKWKDMVEYEGHYRVSNMGRVKSLVNESHVEKIKYQRAPANGYLLASIWMGGKEKKILVHRAVAMAHIPNPLKKKTVNHKNGVKTDNTVGNLEWNTQSENAKHSFSKLNRRSFMTGKKGADCRFSKSVNQYTTNGEFIKKYSSITEAAKEVGSSISLISRTAKGKQITTRGFKWGYA